MQSAEMYCPLDYVLDLHGPHCELNARQDFLKNNPYSVVSNLRGTSVSLFKRDACHGILVWFSLLL